MVANYDDIDGTIYKELGSFLAKLSEFGIKKSNAIVVQSNDQQKLIKKRFRLDSIIIKSSFPLPEKKISYNPFKNKYLLWVGKADQIKNPDALIYLIGVMKNYEFLVIFQREESSEHYEYYFNKLAKFKNVKLYSTVRFYEIDKYFEQSVLLINTSFKEGFPNTFIQAGIAHLPIISLNVSPDNYLQNYKCGYCANGDLKKMINFISRFLKDEHQYLEYSINSHKYVRDNHNLKKNAEQFQQLLLTL